MSVLIADPVRCHERESESLRTDEKAVESSSAVLKLKSGIDIERRFLTILVADVVNYCRLIEIDDVKTVFHLERLRMDVIRPIASCQGVDVLRSFGGDGLVMSFADPVAAVRCAVDFQAQMYAHEMRWSAKERVCFRIGIAMGSVLLVNGNLHGGAINVAARLQALADPGDIWAAEPVVRQLHKQSDIAFEALGELQLRNIEHRVEAYRIRPRSEE